MSYSELVTMVQTALSGDFRGYLRTTAGRNRAGAKTAAAPIRLESQPGGLIGPEVGATCERAWRAASRLAAEERVWLELVAEGEQHPSESLEVPRPDGAALVASSPAAPHGAGDSAFLHEAAAIIRDQSQTLLACIQAMMALTASNARHEGREVVSEHLGAAIERVSELESRERLMERGLSGIERLIPEEVRVPLALAAIGWLSASAAAAQARAAATSAPTEAAKETVQPEVQPETPPIPIVRGGKRKAAVDTGSGSPL